jgi:hypothetical protein
MECLITAARNGWYRIGVRTGVDGIDARGAGVRHYCTEVRAKTIFSRGRSWAFCSIRGVCAKFSARFRAGHLALSEQWSRLLVKVARDETRHGGLSTRHGGLSTRQTSLSPFPDKTQNIPVFYAGRVVLGDGGGQSSPKTHSRLFVCPLVAPLT